MSIKILLCKLQVEEELFAYFIKISNTYLGGLTSVCLCFIDILVVDMGWLLCDVISVIIGFEDCLVSCVLSLSAAELLLSSPSLLKRK